MGAKQALLDATVEYTKTLEQFGQTISKFQALQHRSAHLFSEIEIARAAVMGALTALDSDRPDAALRVSVAKAKAGRVAELARRPIYFSVISIRHAVLAVSRFC